MKKMLYTIYHFHISSHDCLLCYRNFNFDNKASVLELLEVFIVLC